MKTFNPSRFLDEKPPMFQFSGSVFGFNGSNMERLQIMGIIQMWSTDFFGNVSCQNHDSWTNMDSTISLLTLPDSDATTIPASTPDAKAMAAQGTQEARAEQREEKPEKPTDPKGKLDRKIQSQPVLEPDGEKAVKKVKKEKNNTDGEKVATAVKAKAVPPKTESSGSADTARAVQDCLRRPSTKDIVPPETPRQTQPKNTSSCPSQPEKAKKNPGPAEKTKDDTKDTKQGDTKEKEKDELKDKDEKKKKKDKPEVVKVSPGGSNGGGPAPAGKKPPSPPGSPDHSDDEDSSEDSEERKKDELARVKREAHARYMRFSRSLRSRLVYLSGVGGWWRWFPKNVMHQELLTGFRLFWIGTNWVQFNFSKSNFWMQFQFSKTRSSYLPACVNIHSTSMGILNSQVLL